VQTGIHQEPGFPLPRERQSTASFATPSKPLQIGIMRANINQ